VKQSRAMWRRVLDSELLSAAVDHPSQSTQRTTYSLEVLRPRTVDAALVWTRQQSTRHTHDSMPSASPSVRLSVGLSVSISPELHTSDPHQLCTRYLGPWFGRQAVLGTLLVLEGRVLDTSLWLGRPLAACISGSTIQMTSCLHVTGPMDARRRSKRRHCVVVRRLTPLSRNILVAGSETSECIVQGLAGTSNK